MNKKLVLPALLLISAGAVAGMWLYPEGDDPGKNGKFIEPTPPDVEPVAAGDATVMFTIGVHVEPFGTQLSDLLPAEYAEPRGGGGRGGGPRGEATPERSGKAGKSKAARAGKAGKGGKSSKAGRSGKAGKSKSGRPGGGNRGKDYRSMDFFQRHVQDVRDLMDLVESHGGKLVIQAQSPFSDMLIETGDTLFSDAVERGHEVALHFHENAHLGRTSEEVPLEIWSQVMERQVELLEEAGAGEVRYWSGGNIFKDLVAAGAAAGLDVMGDFKSRYVEQADPRMLMLAPWRPSGGPDRADLEAMIAHDRNGEVVFLPSGPRDLVYIKQTASDQYSHVGRIPVVLEAYGEALNTAVEVADPERVNVFHITVHPEEMTGARDAERTYAELDAWLTEVVDPLVESGDVSWATFSEMADAFYAWEEASDLPARPELAETPSAAVAPDGEYISFVINVHDWKNLSDSAATLIRMMDIFEKYGVRGDFYLTAPMVYAYEESHPEVVQRLKAGDHEISYHSRAPHPLTSGFSGWLKELSDEDLYQTLKDFETYRLDMTTGELLRDQPGGYAYVTQVFGEPPVVAPAPTRDPRIYSIAHQVYRDMGALVTVNAAHEGDADPHEPYKWEDGLLVRPSVFGVTRWGESASGKGNFWWDGIGRRPDLFNPTSKLQEQLAAHTAGGAVFVTSLIHENNPYVGGETPFAAVYYSEYSSTRRVPSDPPWDLSTPGNERDRSKAHQAAIWDAYEEMVAWSAANMTVVTSGDIYRMAIESGAAPPE